MHPISTLALWLLANIATASSESAPTPTCTNTITQTASCCLPSAKHTITSYTDCAACALSITTIGPNCDIVHSPPATPKLNAKTNETPTQVRCALPTGLSGTTTITACSLSPTIAIANDDTPAKCTSTLTSTSPFGCTITVPPRTRTEMVDCKGCALETTTVVNSLLGHGVECVGGRKTVTGTEGEATRTACLAERG